MVCNENPKLKMRKKMILSKSPMKLKILARTYKKIIGKRSRKRKERLKMRSLISKARTFKIACSRRAVTGSNGTVRISLEKYPIILTSSTSAMIWKYPFHLKRRLRRLLKRKLVAKKRGKMQRVKIKVVKVKVVKVEAMMKEVANLS